MSAFTTPHQPYREYVQGGMVDGKFVSASFTMVASGPPRLAALGGAGALGGGGLADLALSEGESAKKLFYPLGILQNINLSHNMNLARFFEMGSKRSYFISGHAVGQLGLSRVMYHGPSFLRLLYAYYQDLLPPTIIPPVFPNAAAALVANQHNVIVPPGYENIWLNLASDMFTQPVGLAMFIKDTSEDSLGGVCFEASYIPQHTLATDASGIVMQESVGIQFERAVPIALRGLSLITEGQPFSV